MKKTITVSGEAKEAAVPNMAHLTLGVQTVSPDAKVATRDSAVMLHAVIDAVKALGIEDRQVQTSHLMVYPEHRQRNKDDVETAMPTIIGYRVLNSISVTLDDPSKSGDVIDAAVVAGANSNVGITFGLSNESTLEHVALAKAFEAAHAKARALAKAMGVKLTGPYSLREGNTNSAPIRYNLDFSAIRTSAVSTPVEVGMVDVTADVTVSFRFRR